METTAGQQRGPEAFPLRGRPLRMVLMAELERHGELTVAEMVAITANLGFDLGGRSSKIISDALRWEVRKGRLSRPRRGRYRYTRSPATAARRARILHTRSCEWLRAVLTGRRPPAPAIDPRADPLRIRARPGDPPWDRIGWIWAL